MFWTLSFQLHPGESVIEQSRDRKTLGIDPLYSVFLTNMRAIFRFISLGSPLTQSFFYDEITDAVLCERLLVKYIKIVTPRRSFLLNIPEPDYWAKRIKDLKSQFQTPSESAAAVPDDSADNAEEGKLLEMLTFLKENSLLDDLELQEKIRIIQSRKPA
jgi:hypothetical protein